MFANRSWVAGAILLALAPSPLLAVDPVAERLGRCMVDDEAPIFAKLSGGKPVVQREPVAPVDRGAPLPSVMVDGWKPSPGAIGGLLSQLGRDAGFNVSALASPTVSWDGRTAPLSRVVADLAGQARMDWHYDGKLLKLTPARVSTVAASIRLPADRDARLALVDIAIGRGLSPVFESDRLRVADASKAEAGFSGLADLMLFDVVFLKGRPDAGRYDWGALAPRQRFVAEAGGRFVFDGSLTSLVEALDRQGDVRSEARQTVGGPEGWALEVPASQCGASSRRLSIAPKRVGDDLTLDVSAGSAVGRLERVPLGGVVLVAGPRPVDGWIEMVALRPRLVALD